MFIRTRADAPTLFFIIIDIKFASNFINVYCCRDLKVTAKHALLLMNVTQQKTVMRMLSACLIPQVSDTNANVCQDFVVMEAKVDVWQTLRHPVTFVTTATNLPRAIMTR